MNSNSPSENYFQEKPETASKLSDSQQRILDRVFSILKDNPELNKSLHNAFGEMTKKLLSDPKKFEGLEKLIDENTQKELTQIENAYKEALKAGKDSIVAKEKAINDSK